MNSLERVSAVLSHKEADHVPVYPLINSISRNYMGIDYAKWSNDPDLCVDSVLAATRDIGVDVICSLQDLSVEAADFGQDIEYPANDAAHPSMTNRLVRSIDDYRKIEPIDPRKAPRMSGQIRICDRLVREAGKETPIVAFVFGPLGILSMMRGQAELFLDCLDDPGAVHSALEAINRTLFDYCDALLETGVHAIMFDTLFASQSIMSKSMWNEFEAGYVRKLGELVHSRGAMVMIHNCGKGIYFDAQIEALKPEAISFLYPPDDCTDFADTKAKYGDKTTLIGAITPSWLISATPEQIEDECRLEIDAMAKDGGFILATGCEYPSGLSADKAKLIVNAARTIGKY